MAEDFNASLVISTSEAVTNVRNLDSASKDLDKTLAHLHDTMGKSQGDIDKVAKSLKVFTDTQRTALRDQKARDQQLITSAKLEREQIVNKDKAAQATQRQAMAEAKLAGMRARNGNASASSLGSQTRANALNDARVAGTTALATARATTEAERLAAAQARTTGATAQAAAAQDRAAITALRLADAQARANNSNLALNDSLSNSRYLLYDVGATYGALSAALLAIPAATTAVAASYEKDFAQVIRTTGIASDEANVLFGELKNMSTQIPLSFGELSNIASIAGQLGIAKNEVAAFTDTVAKFSAASNVGISEAATAFGRLEQSFNADGKIPDFYNKIGSAIAKVGVESAASETEIVAVTNQISAAGAQFGFTAEQIVGLSGALASVRIRPELARGAFQRILLQLSRAADEGSTAFDKYAKYTGLAGQAAIDLFQKDPSQFFNKYINGIKGTIDAGQSVSSVLDDIGAKNVFDKQFILGLANGQQVYNKALADSAGAFKDGTFLNSSTAGIFETFAATIQKLGNAFQNLAQTIGGGTLGVLKPLADTILNVATATDHLLNAAPGLKVVVGLFMGMGAVIGVLLALKSAQAFVLAGLVGLQQVMGKTSIQGALSLRGNISELAKTMLMAKGASAEMAASMLANKTAIQQVGLAARTTATQIASGAAATQASGTVVRNAGQATGGFTSALKGLAGGMLSLVGGPVGALVLGLGAIVTGFISAKEEARQAGEAIATALKNGADAGNAAAAQQLTGRKVGSADGASAFSDMGKSADQIARQVGVAFEKVVQGAAGGEAGLKAFRAELERVAKADGYKSLEDAISNPLPGTKAANLQFLNKAVTEMNKSTDESKTSQDAATQATDALATSAGRAAPSAEGLDEALSGVGDSADDAATKIQKAVDAIFGIVNAEAATQESLGKLGAGLQNTTSFNTGTDGGRNNLSAFQDTLRNAALQQQQLIDSGEQTAQQAAANYTAFIDGLMKQLAAKGVDVAEIQALANQAKGVFGDTFASGDQPTITPKVNETAAVEQVKLTTANLQQFIGANNPTYFVDVNADSATAKTAQLAQSLAAITGYPYAVVLDALTNPAAEKSKEIYDLITSITNHTYVAPINADTSAAVANVQSFAAYASNQLNAIQQAFVSTLNMANNSSGFLKGAANVALGRDWTGSGTIRDVPQGVSVQQMSAPVPQAAAIPAPPIATPNFAGLNNGYNDAAKSAKGAGDAGKQAGKDMADGIDDATRAVEDYANRLKTGLQSAFDKQYGMQTAVDAYYTSLNTINKKRQDELKQIDDLIAKQKELNNSRQEDLITARKAGIEKAISQKYGETNRVADYANQEQTALDNAAAKKKDIDATKAQATELQNGIGKLTGYSQAAIDNRAALRDLEQKNLDIVVAYAGTGASVDQVKAKAQALTAQFQRDVTQIGFNKAAVQGLQGNMQRYIGVINTVPRVKPTTVTANTGGASGAIGGVARQLANLPRNTPLTVTLRANTRQFESDWWNATLRARKGIYDGLSNIPARGPMGGTGGIPVRNMGGPVPGFAGGGRVPGQSPSDPRKDNMLAAVDGRGLIKVRSGEFIVQQPAVDYWGLDFFKTLNNMKMPAFNAGGSVGGGRAGSGSNSPVLVELTAENLQAIMRLAERDINLFAGVEQIASSANEGNRILASKGVSQ